MVAADRGWLRLVHLMTFKKKNHASLQLDKSARLSPHDGVDTSRAYVDHGSSAAPASHSSEGDCYAMEFRRHNWILAGRQRSCQQHGPLDIRTDGMQPEAMHGDCHHLITNPFVANSEHNDTGPFLELDHSVPQRNQHLPVCHDPEHSCPPRGCEGSADRKYPATKGRQRYQLTSSLHKFVTKAFLLAPTQCCQCSSAPAACINNWPVAGTIHTQPTCSPACRVMLIHAQGNHVPSTT